MKDRKNRSLIHQAVVAVVLAQLAGALLLCGVALLHERHTRLRALDTRLQGRSDSLLGAIQDAEDPEDNVAIDPAELRLPADDVYAVYNQGARLIGSSHGAPPALITRHGDGFRELEIGHTPYRIVESEAMRIIDRPENSGVGLKRPVTIVYASPEGHLWHEIFEAARFYLLAIAIATGITVLLVIVLLKQSLRPIDELVVAAARLSPPTLLFQPPPSVLKVRELRPLAEVLTQSVTRVRDAFDKEQQFFSDAAHELKTAIAVVRSSVQLLMLRRRTSDEYAAGLARVLQDNTRVEALVAQMLQLASNEGSHAPTPSKTDLYSVAEVALEHLRPVMEARHVPVVLHPAPTMLVHVARERALALITNLVMNAVQHSPAGTPVHLSFEGTAHQQVVMQVADAGSGISAEALPHIFERFYREDRSRSRDTGGTGLGLSICKSIVDAAGGHISVESVPGKETRVTVTFTAA